MNCPTAISRLEIKSHARNADAVSWWKGDNHMKYSDPFVQSFNYYATILDRRLVNVKVTHGGADAALCKTPLVGRYTTFLLWGNDIHSGSMMVCRYRSLIIIDDIKTLVCACRSLIWQCRDMGIMYTIFVRQILKHGFIEHIHLEFEGLTKESHMYSSLAVNISGGLRRWMVSYMLSTLGIKSKEMLVSSLVTYPWPISSTHWAYVGSEALCIGWSKCSIAKDAHKGNETIEAVIVSVVSAKCMIGAVLRKPQIPKNILPPKVASFPVIACRNSFTHCKADLSAIGIAS